MTEQPLTLRALGWTPAFQAQLDPSDLDTDAPMRVAAVHRGHADLLGIDGPARVATGAHLSAEAIAVGDWLLVDRATGAPRRLLARKSLLARRAAGTGRSVQPIAANLDTLFIVSSCNAEFNLARLERYLALAHQAEVIPVIVLTKADLCPDPHAFAEPALGLARGLVVESVNACDPADVARLTAWCGPGETVALVGSSGVGKSTLVNGLTGAGQSTAGVREDDAHGRHTTTTRSLHRLPAGGWLIDTPGMRALRLTDVEDGID